jgi:hypothetical protein
VVISKTRQVDMVPGRFQCHPTAGQSPRTYWKSVWFTSCVLAMVPSLAFISSRDGSRSPRSAIRKATSTVGLASFMCAPLKFECCTR